MSTLAWDRTFGPCRYKEAHSIECRSHHPKDRSGERTQLDVQLGTCRPVQREKHTRAQRYQHVSMSVSSKVDRRHRKRTLQGTQDTQGQAGSGSSCSSESVSPQSTISGPQSSSESSSIFEALASSDMLAGAEFAPPGAAGGAREVGRLVEGAAWVLGCVTGAAAAGIVIARVGARYMTVRFHPHLNDL